MRQINLFANTVLVTTTSCVVIPRTKIVNTVFNSSSQENLVVYIGYIGKDFNLKRGIPIELTGSDGDWLASFLDANIAMSGDSPSDALHAVKSEIEDAYRIYRSESKLGPEPARQLSILESYIGEKGWEPVASEGSNGDC